MRAVEHRQHLELLEAACFLDELARSYDHYWLGDALRDIARAIRSRHDLVDVLASRAVYVGRRSRA